jgi:hypothetical protein
LDCSPWIAALLTCPWTSENAKKATMVKTNLIRIFWAKLKQIQIKKPCQKGHDFFE